MFPPAHGPLLRLAALLGALALCLAAVSSTALAGATPRQADCSPGADGCEGGLGAPVPPTISPEIFARPLAKTLAQGQMFTCGEPARDADSYKGPNTVHFPAVRCRIDVTVSVPAKVASYLGLGSRKIAGGVLTDAVDNPRDENGRRMNGQSAYYLAIPAAVRGRLKAKGIRALGVTIAGTASVVGEDKVYCGNDDSPKPVLHASCPILMNSKSVTWAGEDGELLCWTIMPWWTAVKAHWGKMCPRPMTAR